MCVRVWRRRIGVTAATLRETHAFARLKPDTLGSYRVKGQDQGLWSNNNSWATSGMTQRQSENRVNVCLEVRRSGSVPGSTIFFFFEQQHNLKNSSALDMVHYLSEDDRALLKITD